MLIADILHSCSDEGIAEAAVTSIGGSFASEMRAEAARADQTLGALASSLVRGFVGDATERDWRDLRTATRRSEVPVLSGLSVIATTMMARRVPAEVRSKLQPAPAASIRTTIDACCRLA